jgi:hypothetical protein
MTDCTEHGGRRRAPPGIGPRGHDKDGSVMTVRTAVPWWVTAMAVAVPVCVFPSAAWRLSHVVDVVLNGPGPCHTGGNAETVYIAGLSFGSFGLALLTLGLVRPWGAALPTRLVTAAATTLATVVAVAVGYYLVKEALDLGGPLRTLAPGCVPPDRDVLIYYVPLVAWAPLLYALTYQYHRRNRR